MPDETSERPILDLLANMTAASIDASSLDDQTLMLVRLAALVAVDASAVSYTLNLETGGAVGLDVDQVRGCPDRCRPDRGNRPRGVGHRRDRRGHRRRDRGRRADRRAGERSGLSNSAKAPTSESPRAQARSSRAGHPLRSAEKRGSQWPRMRWRPTHVPVAAADRLHPRQPPTVAAGPRTQQQAAPPPLAVRRWAASRVGAWIPRLGSGRGASWGLSWRASSS